LSYIRREPLIRSATGVEWGAVSMNSFLDKLDIAEEMAKSGTACDWPKFSGGHYKISDSTCSRK
jgi:hypothetical protein